MSPADGDGVFDQFDEAPVPAAGDSAKPPQTIVQNGRPMSSVGALPQPTEDDQASAARGARESAGRTPRQRAQPQGTSPAQKPVAEGENVYDRFDDAPDDDGVALMERLRLNKQDAYYRGSVAGSSRLAALASIYKTPDGPDVPPERKAVNQQMRDEYIKIVSDLAAHEEMQPFGTTMEAMAALGGQLEGTLISPESWIGWGAKGATWIGRTLSAGAQQAGIQLATDPAIQAMNIKAGVQDEYDPTRTILSGAMGFGIGAGGHLAGEGVGRVIGQHQLKKQLFDLGTEDPSFDASRHALWALDPNNGIAAPEIVRPDMDVVRPRMPEEAPETRSGAAPEAVTPRAEAPPEPAEPRYQPGPEHGFEDTVKAEKTRLRDSYGAAQPRASRMGEEARFSAFNDEVGDILQAKVDEHGLDPDAVRYGDIWKFYERAPGQPPEEALESAIGRWVSEEERRAIQSTDNDAQLQKDLDEWARAYDSGQERMSTYSHEVDASTQMPSRFGGRQQANQTLPGVSAIFRDYRPAHLPEEDIPFEHVRPNAAEGGNLPASGEAQPRAAEGTAGGGAEPAVRGERGGGDAAGSEASAAAPTDRGEKLGGPAETLGGLPQGMEVKYAFGEYVVRRVDDPKKNLGTGDTPAEAIASYERAVRIAASPEPSVFSARERADMEEAVFALRSGKEMPPQVKRHADAAREDIQAETGRPATDEEAAKYLEETARVDRERYEAETARLDEHQPIAPEPLATERTAQGEQTVMPGAERESPEAVAARQRARDKEEAEARMRGRKGSGVPQESAEDLALFGGERQKDLLGREIPEDGDLQEIARRRKGGKMAGEPERAPVEKSEIPSPEKDVAIRSLQQQAMDLAEALDFPLRQGRVQSRKAAGTFNLRSGVVRVREVPDFDVVSHEAGHAIESKIGADLTAFTKLHANELKPLDYDQANGGRVNEGFAEFMRLMMTNPAYAERAAPTFALEFRQFMAGRDPVMLAKIDQAAAAYKAYLEASSVDAVGSVRRTVEEHPEGLAKVIATIREDGLPAVIKSVVQKSYDAVLDDKAPFTRVVRELGAAIKAREGRLIDLAPGANPEKLARLAARSRQSATRDLMDGVRPYHEITPEGPALADAITEAAGAPSVWGAWNPEKKIQLSTYSIARRAEYLWRKFEDGLIPNPPVAFSKADAIQAMTDLEAINPNLRNASQMVHDYTRQLLRKSYDGDLIPADLYRKLTAEEFYVPFNRDMSDKPGAGSGSGGGEGPGTTAIVQKLRGSSRDILDPIESIMAQTYLVNRTLAHNDIVKSFVNLAKRAGPEGGKYVEVIPAHEAKKYTADLEQAITNRAKEIGMDPDEARNILSALADPEGGPVNGSYFQMERAAAHGEPIVFYREGGQLKAARFMSEKEGHGLYDLLTATPEPIRDLWGDIVSFASSVKRSSIVTNPTFALTNYIRDQVAASILRSDYVPIYSGIGGIKQEFMQGNNAVLYGYAGGVSGGASVGPVERAFKTETDAMSKKGYLVNRFGSIGDFMTSPSFRSLGESVKGLAELSSFTEAGTRNSIFGTVFEASKRRGLSDYDGLVEAAFQAQDLLDFSRHGSRTMGIRNYLPFLNAHLQGLDKARRTMIEPITSPAAQEFRTARGEGADYMTATVRAIKDIKNGFVFQKDSAEFNNALAAWTKAGALGGALGAGWAALMWENEAYRDASPYFKGTHLVIPWGGKMITIPKPFELGMGFTAGEYAYHALAQNDPRAARMFAESVWDTISPPNPISDMPIVTPSIELALGKSLFTGRDIVPEQLQKLPAAQQFTDRTSDLAKWLGQQTGLSPIKIEYAIGSQFATWGRDVMALSQGVNENSPAASLDDMLFLRRFVKDPTRSSDVTTKFWDYAGRTTGKFNQAVAGYNDLVKEAVTRGQPLTTATEMLAKLPAAEKAFVTLKSAARDNGQPAFTPDERRLHPLQNAYDAVEALNGLRKELSTNATTTFGSREKIQLDPQQRRLLLDNVRELAQMEMRNSLVIMGEGGYAGRPMLDPNDTMDKIRAISPQMADEIATRFATAKVYSAAAVQRSWPKLRDELVRNGSEADVRGLAFDAKAEGYQFGGNRAKKPGIARRPIVGGASPPP